MCQICRSPLRQAIEADMAAMPERAVAAKWQINRNQVQKHRNRCMKQAATAPATARRVAALRDRVKTLVKREKAADKAGNYGEANRCSEAIDAKQREIDTLLSPPKSSGPPSETRWVIRYEDAQDRDDEAVGAARNATVTAVRQALGCEPLPRSARRYALISELADFFGVRREFAEFVIAELEKGKENGEWEAEYHAQSNQKLLPESNEVPGEDADHQARGNDAA